MAGKTGDLNDRQRRFVEEYVIDLDATAAATRAGYSQKTAAQLGYQLLQKASIKAALAAALKARSERTQVSADNVIEELKRVAFSDLGEVLDFTRTDPTLRPACEIPEHARRAVSSIKVRRVFEGTGDEARPVDVIEFKLWDKLSALDKLARHLGMYVDKQEVSGTVRHEHEAARLEEFRRRYGTAGPDASESAGADGGAQPVRPGAAHPAAD